jgi:hypothetical protein
MTALFSDSNLFKSVVPSTIDCKQVESSVTLIRISLELGRIETT